MAGTILIIDDEEGIRQSLSGILEDEGYHVLEAGTAKQGLSLIDQENPDMAFLDIWLPDIDGMEVLKKIKKNHADLPVVMISGHGTIETAVSALRLGAHDFVEKPLSLEKILLIARHTLEMGALRRENKVLREAISSEGDDCIVGNSPVMQEFMKELSQVAPTDAWVLITGENGTGKELAARAIHKGSKRRQAPFVAVNCAAIPEELIESELFGHEKGAFTGADAARTGKFELADGGTLFLDEIADMSLKTQAKILRILQEQRFERVGGTKTLHVDVRVIAATNKNLEESIARGEFRQDLYYRLRVFPLQLPPLRERRGDIPLLIHALTGRVERKYSMTAPTFTAAAMHALENWEWPGNVRELAHLLERLTVLYNGKSIDVQDLPKEMQPKEMQSGELKPGEVRPGESRPGESRKEESKKESRGESKAGFLSNDLQSVSEKASEDSFFHSLLDMDYKSAKNAFEIHYLEHKLREVGGNVTRLAELVGLERSNVHRKLKAGRCQGDGEENS